MLLRRATPARTCAWGSVHRYVDRPTSDRAPVVRPGSKRTLAHRARRSPSPGGGGLAHLAGAKLEIRLPGCGEASHSQFAAFRANQCLWPPSRGLTPYKTVTLWQKSLLFPDAPRRPSNSVTNFQSPWPDDGCATCLPDTALALFRHFAAPMRIARLLTYKRAFSALVDRHGRKNWWKFAAAASAGIRRQESGVEMAGLCARARRVRSADPATASFS